MKEVLRLLKLNQKGILLVGASLIEPVFKNTLPPTNGNGPLFINTQHFCYILTVNLKVPRDERGIE